MPKDEEKKKQPKTSSAVPDVQSQSGGINPSAPSTGTEGWGQTSDERRVLSTNDPHATRAGQMQGNPGDHMRAASEREEKRATSNKSRSDSTGDNQADLSRLTSASAHSMSTSQGGADHTYRCADAGNADCQWETSGGTEEEVMRRIEEHQRQEHGLPDWTEAMRSKVRDAIRHRRAA